MSPNSLTVVYVDPLGGLCGDRGPGTSKIISDRIRDGQQPAGAHEGSQN